MDMAAIAQAGQAMPMAEDIEPALLILKGTLIEGEDRKRVDKVVHFLSLILQMQKQLHLSDEVKEPQNVSLRCSGCSGDFAVDVVEFAEFHEAGGRAIPCPNDNCDGVLDLPQSAT